MNTSQLFTCVSRLFYIPVKSNDVEGAGSNKLTGLFTTGDESNVQQCASIPPLTVTMLSYAYLSDLFMCAILTAKYCVY